MTKDDGFFFVVVVVLSQSKVFSIFFGHWGSSFRPSFGKRWEQKKERKKREKKKGEEEEEEEEKKRIGKRERETSLLKIEARL